MSNPYPPELYAKLHLGNPGDLAFYREQCRDARTILELGCGYGRVLEALCDPDRRLVGLDLSRGLLELAQLRLRNTAKESAALVRGDMRHFAFAHKFDRILIPYSAIYCLLSVPDLHACLSRVAEHLNPEGLLIFDAYNADVFHNEDHGEQTEGGDVFIEADEEDEADEVACIDHAGTVYHVVERADWSREDQRLDVVYTHEPRRGGSSIAARLEHRYLLSEQVAPLLEGAGLRLVSLFGDYLGNPIGDESEMIVATARPA
jgi:SAM-dependent methyltransferase